MANTNTDYNIGVKETQELLRIREELKRQMTPDQYKKNMIEHKASIQTVLDDNPGHKPMDAALAILDLMDKDDSLREEQRNLWKRLCITAAFEMSEF